MVREIPDEVRAAWPEANYVDPEKRGPALVILTAVFMALVLVFVLMRLYVYIRLLRRFGWDDLFLVLAFVSIMFNLS